MDTEDDVCDQESPKSEESDLDESDHSTLSETEGSSDLDDESIEIRKGDCIAEGQELEKAFQLVKNLLYEERLKHIESRLDGLKSGTEAEYLEPLKQLDEKLSRKLEVAAKRREYRLHMIGIIHESESLSSHQNLENDKLQLYDTVRNELEEKIRRLEEDRHNIDIHSDLWEKQLFSKKHRSRRGGTTSTSTTPLRERRKKPLVVTGPYVIYMLDDMDILEDWTTIKKALKQRQQVHRRPKSMSAHHSSAAAKEKYTAKYMDGKLSYRGDYYNKGHHIIIDNKEDSPVHASITAINTGEIWVKKSDGNKSKLYIAQLQRGKYTIRHAPY